MEIISQTLIVLRRTNPSTSALELLMGTQVRGPWRNYLNFPGGKADGPELLPDTAVRELGEETGIHLAPTALDYLGKLIVCDRRPDNLQFGTVAIYGTTVGPDVTFTSNAAEINCLWVNPSDTNIALEMPPDVKFWLPLALDSTRQPFSCHRTVDKEGNKSFETVINRPGQQIELFS